MALDTPGTLGTITWSRWPLADVADSVGAGLTTNGTRVLAGFRYVSTTPTNTYYELAASTWTQRTLPGSKRWSAVAYVGGRFVMLHDSAASPGYNSADGVSGWVDNVNVAGVPPTYARVAQSGSLYFCGHSNTGAYYTASSYDDWTYRTGCPLKTQYAAAVGGNGFIFVCGTSLTAGGESASVARTSDGIGWTLYSLPNTSVAVTGAVFLGGALYVSAYFSAKVYVYKSTDNGASWTGGDTDIPVDSSKVFLTADAQRLALVVEKYSGAYSNAAYLSTDGVVWSSAGATPNFSLDEFAGASNFAFLNDSYYLNVGAAVYTGTYTAPPPLPIAHLLKTPIVTVIPGTAGQAAQAGSYVCQDVGTGVGGISDGGVISAPPPPPSSGSSSGYTPSAGEHIYLRHNGVVTESVAPAPAGYVCRLETVNPIFYGGATLLNVIVCDG